MGERSLCYGPVIKADISGGVCGGWDHLPNYPLSCFSLLLLARTHQDVMQGVELTNQQKERELTSPGWVHLKVVGARGY